MTYVTSDYVHELHLYDNILKCLLNIFVIAADQSPPTTIPASQGAIMHLLSTLWLSTVLPCLLWASHVSLIVEGDNDASRICKPAPKWEIKGQAPMQELLGNVVVVALLKAS